MTKKELSEKLSERGGLNKAESVIVLNELLDIIRTEVKGGGEIKLVGFGTFSLGHRAARKGVNPSTKQPMDIPAKDYGKFKASSTFLD